MFTVCMFAVQAYRRPFQAVLDDGRTVTVRLTGDEFFHRYVDEEGNTLERLPDGRFTRETSPWLSRARRAEGDRLRLMANERRMQRAAKARKAGTFKGAKKGLVILVSYTDVKIQEKHTQAVFNDMFNKEGYSDGGHIGSVRDYFKAQSYGQFEIDFDVVGPYTLEHERKYYGENQNGGGDKRLGEMIAEAVKLADNDVNYKYYDWDDDGEVDQVFIVFAGFGEASGPGLEDCIWPVEWYLSSSDYGRTIRLDGVRIDQFACSCELNGVSGTQLGGIGTACHEFSHCLGLPDFYDTRNGIEADETNFGMDSWSVMDYGCYNGTYDPSSGYTNANIPSGYTSYERMFCGWLEPRELADGCKVNDMWALTDSAQAYIIYNDANHDEYYLLENRQKTSWDKAGGGHGLLVIHVDYKASAWYDNTVNNDPNHQRCTVIAADNKYKDSSGYASASNLAGDPYPGTSKNTALTDETTPAATLYNASSDGRKFMGKPIEEIKESNGKISFLFMGGDSGTLRTPKAETATDVKEHSFVAHWSEVSDATSYTLALTSGDADPVYFQGIPTNSLEVTGLDSTVVHSYCVKAVAEGRESAWSNTITVRLKGFGEWSEWEPFGDGTAVYHYSDQGLFDAGDKTLPIFVRTSNIDPAKQQFRLYGWGYDMTLDIDYDAATGHCSVAQQYTGYTDTYYGVGKVYVADEVYYYNDVLHFTTTWNSYPSSFNPATGTFTLYVAYYDLVDIAYNWGEAVETINVNGEFKNYTIDVSLGTLTELSNGKGSQEVTFTPGSSVAYWRYTLIDKEVDADNVNVYVNALNTGVVPSENYQGTQRFTLTVSSGIYSVLAVAYDEQGNAQSYDYKTFRFSSNNEWRVLGMARYTDDVLCTLFEGMDMVTYDVEVQENKATPGLFRMKNPYGKAHPYNQVGDILEGDFYIEIDATDPNAVKIPLQDMGVDWGYGPCQMVSVSAQGYYGKFDGTVITFPTAQSIILRMGDSTYKSNWYGGFRLDLSTCGISIPQDDEIVNSKSSNSKWYDLQGRPVLQPRSSGFYIQNGKKVLVK